MLTGDLRNQIDSIWNDFWSGGLANPLQAEQLPMSMQERILPPKQFDHDYDGELIIHRTLEDQLFRICRLGLKPGQRALGCAFLGAERIDTQETCTIWIVTDDDLRRWGYAYEYILRHEVGHCNGWKHD